MGPYMLRFQIRDLERFSGVKAHTIRMWERRYHLLAPGRTATNIRSYDLNELRTILNVAYLNQHGHKISRIAAMAADQRDRLVHDMAQQEKGAHGTLDTLVLAMLGFDEALFEQKCSDHVRQHGFRSLAEEVFMPLLARIGLLWQSNAICPAHEHFVSNLIRQWLIISTVQLAPVRSDGALHVLFLPENEIHELGLLYVNYLLRARGERTIYLGQSVPLADLRQLITLQAKAVVFVSLLVVRPSAMDVITYLRSLREELPGEQVRFLIAGTPLSEVPLAEVPEGMVACTDLAALIKVIERS